MSEFNEKFTFKEWEDYNLHDDTQLDKYALEEAAELHSALMQKWLDLLAQAQAELSKAKEVLQNEEAKLFLKFKAEGIPDISKPTEATVKSYVYTQPEYRKAQRRKRKAENNVAYLQNARSVLEHRKSMIKVASDLWICGYFAKPHVSGDIKKQVNEERKKDEAVKLKSSLRKRHLRQTKDNE